ncbi:Malic enzyme, partial [Phytophthora palmivora]
SAREIPRKSRDTDRVEDTGVCYAGVEHTCPETTRLMVDRGMAKGIMLKKSEKMEKWTIEKVRDMIFSDFMFPGLHDDTRYSAVLIGRHGLSRFMTMNLLKSKP